MSEPVCINQQGYECLQHELADGFFNRINLLAAGRSLIAQKARAEETLAQLRDPMTRALKLWELGVDAVTRMETECERICRDPGDRKLKRFCDMINAVFSLMVDRGGMRLEVFQVELMRGFFIGIAANQFRDDLFKYKHIILDLLGLATPEIVTFNPLCPSLAVSREIDRLFDEYGKNYTLALAPRQCGKTTIMVILLAAMITYLDIEIVVQAQHKTMCETLYDRVELVLHEIQHSTWYPEENRIVTIKGTTETREFIYDPAYKGTTRVHFLSSSPNVSNFFISFKNVLCGGRSSGIARVVGFRGVGFHSSWVVMLHGRVTAPCYGLSYFYRGTESRRESDRRHPLSLVHQNGDRSQFS